MSPTDPRIFVNIASYRDSECQWTVKDLFEKALNPDRVFAGICWQFVPGDDDDCFQVETRPDQCRVVEVHAKDSKGACWARSQAQSLWDGEEYTLQIDSHMRFVAEWDRILLEMLAECPSQRPVLSTYPLAYEPPDKLSPDSIVTIYPKWFDKHGILMFRSQGIPPKKAPDEPQPNAFCAAGFLFAPSAINEDVPYDPYIYFQGEEITLAVRLFTNGWDVFTPSRVVAYHDYTKRPGRSRHWNDQTDWSKLNDLSFKRVRHLLGIEETDDEAALIDIGKFDLGERRTLAEYEEFSAVGFAARSINGERADPPPADEGQTDHDRRKGIFTAIWEQNGWRCAETRSGPGAMLSQTEAIRRKLKGVFEELDIRILADAGCGELNWMNTISEDLRLYLGFDLVDGVCDLLRENFGARRNHFFSNADIITETLPQSDAILCRDCLTHFTPDEVKSTLQQFRASGSTYLIATTHSGGTNAEINSGGWYPMDLEQAPFTLPPPLQLLDEELAGTKKSLGVWKLADLP